MNLAARIYGFEETMREWLGDGCHPDPQAQDRADICCGKGIERFGDKVVAAREQTKVKEGCPFNYRGGWIVPKKIADTIRRWVEIKTKLNLEVEGEEKLGHCELCSCRLNLKIHVPRQTILNHSSAEPFEEKAPWCWLVTENNKTTQ